MLSGTQPGHQALEVNRRPALPSAVSGVRALGIPPLQPRTRLHGPRHRAQLLSNPAGLGLANLPGSGSGFTESRRLAVIQAASRKAAGSGSRSGSEASGGAGGASSSSAPAAAAGSGSTAVAERVEERELYDETYNSYLSYAMTVIVSRAIPDVRDGLKPVHRRILFAMHELGLTHSKPFKKCARVVGEVLGKLHPHGDNAVYDTLVRMAQWFSMREPLVDGHGNFGSLDADPAAAMRYTECRLTPLAEAVLLRDLGRETVDWRPTFDESQEEPVVLPAVVPQLLVNGSSGIAVGIASSIPSHNLGEVVGALRALIADPGVGLEELMTHVKGPDFPTGGELLVGPELAQAYATGRGSVVLRGIAAIERTHPPARKGRGAAAAAAAAADAADEAAGGGGGGGGGGRERIVITELPYQVCKSDLVSSIASLADSKALEGVADVRDESDRTGTRVVVEVRRGHSAELLLSQLFTKTRLQTTIHFNCVSLVGSQPRCLGLKDMLQAFLDFRCEVVTRRSQAQLSAAQTRAHILDGFLGLLHDPARLDAVVAAVRGAADAAAAKQALVAGHGLSEAQAESVLGLTLRRLTGLEADKLARERRELDDTISRLQHVLSDRAALLAVVEAEAAEAAERFPDGRRTRLASAAEAAAAASSAPAPLPPARPCLLLSSRRGFLRRLPLEGLAAQGRNTRGKSGLKLRSGDALSCLASGGERDGLLLFTPEGRAFQTAAGAVPGPAGAQAVGASSGSATSSTSPSGASVANILSLDATPRIAALLPIPEAATPPPATRPKAKASAAAAAAAGAADADAASPSEAEAGGEAEGHEAEEHGEGEEAAEAESAGPNVLLASRGGLMKRIALPSKKITRSGLVVMSLASADTATASAASPGDGAKTAKNPKTAASAAATAAGDELGWAALVESPADVVVCVSARGQALAFPATQLRLQSRAARGVKALRLGSVRRPDDSLAAVAVLPAALAPRLAPRNSSGGGGGEDGADDGDAEHGHEQEEEEEEAAEDEHGHAEEGGAEQQEGEEDGKEGRVAPTSEPCLLLVTAHGSGKRVKLSQLAIGRRAAAGQKVISLVARSRAGAAGAAADRVVAALVVRRGEEVVLASRNGVVVRQQVDRIAVQGRYARGNFVMALDEGDEVAAVVRAVPYGADGGGAEGADAGAEAAAAEGPAAAGGEEARKAGKGRGGKAKGAAAAAAAGGRKKVSPAAAGKAKAGKVAAGGRARTSKGDARGAA